jgi:hypothetical protein
MIRIRWSGSPAYSWGGTIEAVQGFGEHGEEMGVPIPFRHFAVHRVHRGIGH